MACMKRVILLIAIVAIGFVCWSVAGSHSVEFVSTVNEKLSTVLEKAKELLPSPEGSQDEDAIPEEGDGWSLPSLDLDEWSLPSLDVDGWSLPSLEDIGIAPSILNSTEDVALVPVDYYAQSYVFEYGGEQFTAYFDGNSWRVYNSYRITNHSDIVTICQALINEHPVYGSDWASYRTAKDMAYEWEQHNLAYRLLPEDSHWRNDARDVDLDPNDQGKSFPEIYESRTGEKFDIKKYLS